MKIGGRDFALPNQELTAAQNDYIQGHLARAGVTDLFVEMHTRTAKPSDEELGEVRKEFITRILLSGSKSAILAGCLTEVGKKWTRAEAEKNAALFDEITDRDELLTMTQNLAGVVIAFFLLGGTSSTTSPRSSNPSAEVLDTSSAAPVISESLPR